MRNLVLCPGCCRHIRYDEPSCPFCRRAHAPASSAVVRTLGAVVAGVALVGALAHDAHAQQGLAGLGVGPAVGRDPGTVASAYGAPPDVRERGEAVPVEAHVTAVSANVPPRTARMLQRVLERRRDALVRCHDLGRGRSHTYPERVRVSIPWGPAAPPPMAALPVPLCLYRELRTALPPPPRGRGMLVLVEVTYTPVHPSGS